MKNIVSEQLRRKVDTPYKKTNGNARLFREIMIQCDAHCGDRAVQPSRALARESLIIPLAEMSRGKSMSSSLYGIPVAKCRSGIEWA